MPPDPAAAVRPSPVRHLLEMKRAARPIVAMAAYDALFARLLEEAGVDLILVGDSLGRTVLGYDSTTPVTMEEMIHHARAVRRGAPGTIVVFDMPFLSYQVSEEEALRNAGRALKETGADAVKVEGGHERTRATVRTLVAAGVPVMGHLALAAQSAHPLDAASSSAGTERAEDRVREEAEALERAGVFGLVLETLPAALAREVTSSRSVPTIGIGSGPACDGQVQLLWEALGLTGGPSPKVPKRFAALREAALEGVRAFADEVREGTYPAPVPAPGPAAAPR
jgi:3-methyl-2-oxobutanoate hydroxymethyltransferase